MTNLSDRFEEKLDTQIRVAEKLRDSIITKLASPGSHLDMYTNLLSKLREINIFDPRKGEANPKEFIRHVNSSPPEARKAIAFKGPRDGVAKSLLKYLPVLGLSPDENLSSALLCIQEDYEQCFQNLPSAKLPTEDYALVIFYALKNHPIFSFEVFKTQEVIYQTANTDDKREMMEIQRRFEQMRSKKSQHIRKHAINRIPDEIRQQLDCRFMLLKTSMQRDTFGTLEALREAITSEEIKTTTSNLLADISIEDKLALIEIVARLGLGLASNYLNLFDIPNEPEWQARLQEILKTDIIAGHSLFGAYALEGIQYYPFDLGRIEIMLPRRITNAEATEYLKRGDAENEKQRQFTSNEIGEAATMLQERDVKRFVENLKAEVGRHWKSYVSDTKRNIIFGDLELKVRDILFLLTQSLFQEEDKFDNIMKIVEKNHPTLNDQTKILLFANRCYFLNLLGLNTDFLFTRTHKPTGSFGSLIEDVSDYQARNLLHLGMSIFIRIGNAIFKDAPIAWNMLIGQCEGKIDTAFQEVGQLFDAIDTLLTISEPLIIDLPVWADTTLLEALLQDVPDLPIVSSAKPIQTQLRVTTRAMIARTRETLGRYCIDALYARAKLAGVTPLNIIQTLKMPRSKTDKLQLQLFNDPKKEKRK
ncbi:MAG: hypothetical protein FWG02_06035 [Holophagaceae bacterium]|nr:hypothetical protein [Holophagaceae bacterium]